MQLKPCNEVEKLEEVFNQTAADSIFVLRGRHCPSGCYAPLLHANLKLRYYQVTLPLCFAITMALI